MSATQGFVEGEGALAHFKALLKSCMAQGAHRLYVVPFRYEDSSSSRHYIPFRFWVIAVVVEVIGSRRGSSPLRSVLLTQVSKLPFIGWVASSLMSNRCLTQRSLDAARLLCCTPVSLFSKKARPITLRQGREPKQRSRVLTLTLLQAYWE